MTDRPTRPLNADERTTVDGFLDFHRATLLWKCEELSDEQLRRRSMPPSTLSLLGLVRHLTDLERGWFRSGPAGEDAPPLYSSDNNPDGDIDDVDDADVAANLDAYRAEVDAVRAAIAGLPLNATITESDNTEISLRWIYLHMIEEYARHNGHADLLRQAIDGATGE